MYTICPRATSEKINQGVIAKKQSGNNMENQNMLNLSKRKWGKLVEKGKLQMGEIEMNSKMADLNLDEYVIKLNKNDLNFQLKGTDCQTG